MDGLRYAMLPGRGALEISGADVRSFLQGLVSNDIHKVAPDRAIYSALLTPQGRYLHDFFIVQVGSALVLDCEAARADDLRRRLSTYKLRSKVDIADAGQLFVIAALMGGSVSAALGLANEAGAAKAFAGGAVYVDPRLAEAGCRAILPREGAGRTLTDAGFTETGFQDYERLRLSLGLPDGSRDLEVEKAILLENGFDELHGIDWDKGCYMGQELTARTRYRGLVRKRLMPVEIDGPAPKPGTPVMLAGKEAGEMRSALDGIGLALIRLETLAEAEKGGAALLSGTAKLRPTKPDWARFPAADEIGT
ncbi:MAG: folate-binding protein [Alphaproteobacteria bacterium]